MAEICSIIHRCAIYSEKNYLNLDFSSPTIKGTNPLKINSTSGFVTACNHSKRWESWEKSKVMWR